MYAQAFKVGMRAPDDVSAAAALLDQGAFRAEHVVAILGKTEGNGAVNDYTRGHATLCFQMLIAERTKQTVRDVAKRVPIIWSGGTEGLMSPHATIFTREPDRGAPSGEKRFAIGTAYTRDLLPEEFGTAVHARVAAGARRRGRAGVTTDTYKSMSYARAVAALGIGSATGEIPAARLTDDVAMRDFSVFSDVASTSSGVELMNCEIIVLGNSTQSTSDLVIAHAVMKDAIDAAGVREALKRAGLAVVDGDLSERDRNRLINVFAKCEPDASGATRGRRHVMFEDGDINYTRHIRGAVNSVIASVTGDTMCYVSAGAEHQGPPGGGVVAVLARVR